MHRFVFNEHRPCNHITMRTHGSTNPCTIANTHPRVRTRKHIHSYTYPHTHTAANTQTKPRANTQSQTHTYLKLARTIYIRCIYSIFGRKITKYTVKHGVYIRFWPTLHIPFLACQALAFCGHTGILSAQ